MVAVCPPPPLQPSSVEFAKDMLAYLPTTLLSRFSVKLSFVHDKLGMRLFAREVQTSPLLKLQRFGGVFLVASARRPEEVADPVPVTIGGTTTGSRGASTRSSTTGEIVVEERGRQGKVSDEAGEAGDADEDDEDAGDADAKWARSQRLKHWLMISLSASAVEVAFVHPQRSQELRNRTAILTDLRLALHAVATRVNQLLLLHQLHETREASGLLIEPGASDPPDESLEPGSFEGTSTVKLRHVCCWLNTHPRVLHVVCACVLVFPTHAANRVCGPNDARPRGRLARSRRPCATRAAALWLAGVSAWWRRFRTTRSPAQGWRPPQRRRQWCRRWRWDGQWRRRRGRIRQW